MKRTILILVTALAVLTVGFNQRTKEYVLTGQFYNTPSPGVIEKIYGKVKEIKVTNYLVKEENGKFVKDREFTAKDRVTFVNVEPTFKEEYSPSGIIAKSTSYDENGKVTSYWTAESTGKSINNMTYYSADTITAYGKATYKGTYLEGVKYYNPKNDTLYMSIKYEYDQNGNRTKLQTYNYKGEQGGYTLYKYNDKGLLIQTLGYNKDRNPTLQSDHTRSDKGDRLTSRQETFGANGRVINYTFKSEYDNLGNWVKSLMYVDNKPLIIRERQIKYYE